MVEIITTDILTAFKQYMPHAVISGVIVITAVCLILRLRSEKTTYNIISFYKKKLIILYITYVYGFCVVFITFLSREPGSREGMDLRLFSTFSRNLSDNIFPVENILLFVPFGFLLPLLWDRFHNVIHSMAAAFLLSLAIEVSQYLTERGYFQIDDIITNALGSLIGYIIYRILQNVYGQMKK